MADVPERRTALGIPAKLGLIAAGILLAVIALESSAHLLHLDPGMLIWVAPSTCVRRSALLGEEFRPDCDGVILDTRFHTNSLGLRGDDVPDDGSRRVLAIGDSCTWGWRVEDPDTYPVQLQGLLNGDGESTRYTVINAGAPGYTSYHGLLYLRERGLKLRPNLIIAAYGFNEQFRKGDVRDALVENRRLMPILDLDEALASRSLFYRWARVKMHVPMGDDLPRRVAPDQYERNLAEIVALARSAHVPVLLLSFLIVSDGDEYVAAEKSAAVRAGVGFVRYRGPRLDIIHPTAAGYAALAETLHRRIRDDQLIR